MSLSPLQLIAGASLANNTGIAIANSMTDSINSYRSTALIAPFANTLSNSQLVTLVGNLAPTLLTLTASTCPALSDSTPSNYAANVGIKLSGSAAAGNSVNGFTGIITSFGDKYLGSGDNSIFVQAFVAAEGYINTTNNFILTTNNSDSFLGSNFTGMNNLITGSLGEVTLAYKLFGQDLKALGVAIDLAQLPALGSPLALIQQLLNVARLTPGLITKFEFLGIPQEIFYAPPTTLMSLMKLEKTLYQVFSEITGADLTQVLQLLSVTTPNIQSMADLLNPVKIFPNSFSSLTVKTINGPRQIYLDDAGTVDINILSTFPDYVQADYTKLSQLIPTDQALANEALKISLQQIKNIQDLSLPVLADTYLNMVSTKDLPLLNDLKEPVPAEVTDFYKNSFPTGTGPDGTLVITDAFGAASGTGYIDQISNTVTAFGSLASNSSFANLITVYQRMDNTINNVYGNAINGPVVIPAGPAAGTYTVKTDPIDPLIIIQTAAGNAFGNGLIPNATSSVSSIVSSQAVVVEMLNQDWNSMAEKLISESNIQESASINYSDLTPNEKSTVLNFIESLPDYGTDTSVNNKADFLEIIANKNTLGGQAIVGTLRQGKNAAVLDAAGIGRDSSIPATPSQLAPQINTSSTDYSAEDAREYWESFGNQTEDDGIPDSTRDCGSYLSQQQPI